MTNETMTIHKALIELKTLDSRISKEIGAAHFVITNKHSNKKVNGVTVEEYTQTMKADYQKVNDLIKRRNAIKKAVVLSNAVTKVTIGGKEYTVAEAIEMKNHGMDHKLLLLDRIEREFANAKRDIEKHNGEYLEGKADAYLATLYGSSDMKNLADDVQKVRKDFIEAQTLELVDPISVEKVIESLKTEIDTFMVDVDSTLSVSNALTTIEISY
jgi:pyruvate/2-oxoacid:ferredoxin oxidoreductase alpha subunit